MAEKKSASTTKSSPAKKSKDDAKQASFEDALQELQTLVDAMEKGDISLEQSLQAFERGVELTKFCQTALFRAEQKVQQLNADGQIEDLLIATQESESSGE